MTYRVQLIGAYYFNYVQCKSQTLLLGYLHGTISNAKEKFASKFIRIYQAANVASALLLLLCFTLHGLYTHSKCDFANWKWVSTTLVFGQETLYLSSVCERALTVQSEIQPVVSPPFVTIRQNSFKIDPHCNSHSQTFCFWKLRV